MLTAENLDYHNLQSTLQSILQKRIEECVDRASVASDLKKAVCYSAAQPGKCLRPLLSLLVCHDMGGDELSLVEAAVALELVHSSTLVHDDLPSLDNDIERRGRASCHVACGEATAILAGDVLVSLAFSQLCKTPGYSCEERLKLVSILSESFTAVMSGQSLDLAREKLASEDDIKKMYFQKTGALFSAATLFGGIGASANDEQKTLLGRFGMWLGLYFQLADDYIDLFGTDVQRGRGGSSDTRNKRANLFQNGSTEVALRLLAEAKEQTGKYLASIEQTLSCKPIPVDGSIEMSATRFLLEQIYSRVPETTVV
jgi:geranylgeranyl diphosphate synthase type II